MKRVPDCRCARRKAHDLSEMPACLVAGYANGRTSVGRALAWCENHIGMLQEHMELKNGIASEAAISRMLNGIDEEIFALVFIVI